ncbi:MAG: KEOPS complex subunit Pcc1 [Thermoplasmata archaeon]
MSYSETAEFEFEEPDAEIIYQSLIVESLREIPRTKIELSTKEKMLKLTIYAEDVNALRSAINSYLRWINLSINILELKRNGRT